MKFLPGDRFKLTGAHRWAGHTAVFVREGLSPFGPRPMVSIEPGHEICFVMEPETQMVAEPTASRSDADEFNRRVRGKETK